MLSDLDKEFIKTNTNMTPEELKSKLCRPIKDIRDYLDQLKREANSVRRRTAKQMTQHPNVAVMTQGASETGNAARNRPQEKDYIVKCKK